MAGFFGADFNANQPSDDDLVKKGAAIFRDIKGRLKTTWGVLFNLEDGNLKPNIISHDKLKDLDPDPSGSWNRVEVNEKGLVVAGEEESTAVASLPQRYVYRFAEGRDPDGAAIAGSLDADGDGLVVRAFSFTVPEGVDKIIVQVQGAGGGGGSNATSGAGGGGGGGGVEAILDVNPSDVYLVWVGQGGTGEIQGGAAAVDGAMTKFEFDGSSKIECPGGENGATAASGAGGSTDVYGWTAYAQSNSGSAGTTTAGGQAGGRGFAFDSGAGGSPTNGSASPGLDGAHGRVIITYWTVPA